MVNRSLEANSAEAMIAAYRRHLETCRRMADVMLDATGRLEQIGLNMARSTLHGSLDAAGSIGSADPATLQAAQQPGLDGLVQMQREIADTMGRVSGDIMRLMTEYGASLGQSVGASMPAGMTPPAAGFEALAKTWNDALQRYSSLIQSTVGSVAPKSKG
ncbi:MAG TPA: phasin family protein [Burkholderiaceae bacterium]|nr:phasin family protein [Burkholderiaceae bacterium]